MIEFLAWSNKYKHMFRVRELSQDRDGYTHGLIDEGFEDEYEPDYESPFAFIGRVDFTKSPDGKTSGLCQDSDDEPFILIQYSGLKDKNGMKIFDGYLLKDDENFVWKVIFKNGAFYVECDDLIASQLLSSVNIHCEVVGNIYENTELLNK